MGLEEWSSYDQVIRKVSSLYEEAKFEEIIQILESIQEKYPEKEWQVTDTLVYSYYQTGQFAKCLQTWEYGLQKGIFYGIDPERYDRIEISERFSNVLEQDRLLKAKAQEESKPDLDVVTPKGYGRLERYPLFIVLHRGYQDREFLLECWRSDVIASEYVLAFVRSSQVLGTNTYTWANVELGKKDVERMYRRIVEEFSVDAPILVGGMSGDGGMAIEVAVDQMIPVRGFVAFCPAMPKELDKEKLSEAARQGVRGSILAGEYDFLLSQAKELSKVFDESHLSCRLVIGSHSHVIPDDAHQRIDGSISFILDSSEAI